MSHANRALNRTLALIVGLALLLAGGAAAAAVLWPAAGAEWTRIGTAVVDAAADATARTQIGETTASWSLLAGVAVAAVLIVLLVIALFSAARRRTRTVLGAVDDATAGRVIVRESFAADALSAALGARADVLSSRIRADEFDDTAVLQVTVIPRRNASARELADHLAVLTTNLNRLIGTPTPTYVSLRASVRAQVAPERRILT